MIALQVKMRSGEVFSAQMETLDQARELIANKPFVELNYGDGGFVVLNTSEVAFIAAATQQQQEAMVAPVED